uniref:Immunoglobulin V-set domain-containing protein n=1 Tax=Anabas testudineus TaxID=64144 RepID=A0A3Q1HKG4_ANATE
ISFNHHAVIGLLFSSFKCVFLSGVSCEDLTPVNSEQFTIEGNSVTLIYNYPKLSSSNYFFWYRQYSGKPPELLISHSATGAVGTEKISGLKVKVEQKQLMMNISSAAVSDSAVYYCALQPTTLTGCPDLSLRQVSSFTFLLSRLLIRFVKSLKSWFRSLHLLLMSQR